MLQIFSILLVLFVGTVTTSDATEYLVDVYVDSTRIGNYFVYEDNGKLTGESNLFKDLGFPVEKDSPLEILSKSAEVGFDKRRQILTIKPFDKNLFKKHKTKTVQNATPYEFEKTPFALKNIDYSLSLNYESESMTITNSYFLRATGSLFSLNYDLFLYPEHNYIGLEKTHNGFRFKLGYIPDYGYRGLYFSNESSSVFIDQFSEEKYIPTVPPNSLIDVFRNDEYLYTTTYRGEPLILPLIYGSNTFRIVSKTPDGSIITEEVKKDISSLLLPKGKFSYTVSAGKNDYDNKLQHNIRLGYGLTNSISLYGQSNTNQNQVSIVGQLLNKLIYQIGVINDERYKTGFKIDLSHSNFYLSYNKFASRSFLSVSGYLPLKYVSFSIQHSETRDKLNGLKYTTNRLSSYLFYKNLFLSPFISIRRELNHKYLTYGFNSMFLPTYDWRVNVSFESEKDLQKQNYHHGDEKQKLSFDLTKTISSGYIQVSMQYEKLPEESLKLNKSAIKVNLYSFKYANLQLTGEYNHIFNSYTVYASISGSISKQGLSNQHLSEQALLCFIPFLDSNLNYAKDSSEELVKTDIEIFGYKTIHTNQYHETCLNLPASEKRIIRFYPAFDSQPKHDTIMVTPERGQTNYVYMPYFEIVDIEGTLDKDNLNVLLIDKNTGKVIQQTKTRFGGWYLFRVPKYMVNQVQVVFKTEK